MSLTKTYFESPTKEIAKFICQVCECYDKFHFFSFVMSITLKGHHHHPLESNGPRNSISKFVSCFMIIVAHHWHVQEWMCGQKWTWCTKILFCLKTNYANNKHVLERKNFILREWHTPTTWALFNSTPWNVFWSFQSTFDLKLFFIISMSIRNNKYIKTYNIQMSFH